MRHIPTVAFLALVLFLSSLFTFVLPAETAAAADWGRAADEGLAGDYRLVELSCDSSAVFDEALYIGTSSETEGCGVWRRDTSGMTLVNDPGFGNDYNYSALSMAVFEGGLYVGTFNPNGCEVWRYDGTSWSRAVGPGGSVGRGFGNENNIRASSMAVFGGRLYVGTQNTVEGLEIWRTDGGSWVKSDGEDFGPANKDVSSMRVYDPSGPSGPFLYVGTANTAGCEVWRSSNGTAWFQKSSGGFGSGSNVTAASMAVFGGRLYVGTERIGAGLQIHSTDGTGWSSDDGGLFGGQNAAAECMGAYGGRLYVGTRNESQGAQVWSAPDGSTWSRAEAGELALDRGATTMSVFSGSLYVGTTRYADVWRYDGSWSHVSTRAFTSNSNLKVSSMAVYEGRLYVGTLNPLGCEVWRFDGSAWERLAAGGFGECRNDAVQCMEVYKGDLYIGTSNSDEGCQAWRFDGSTFTKLAGGGFDDLNNEDVRCMAVYGGRLYVGTSNDSTGGELYAYDGTDGYRVNDDGFGAAANIAVESLAVMGGRLYAGTSSRNGCEVWSTAAEGGPPYTDWSQLAAGGFGDADNREAATMEVLGDTLHVGTFNDTVGCEVWSYDGSDWGQACAAGFGDARNREASSMAVHGGRLYVGTWQEGADGGTGCEVWSTAGAGGLPYADWTQENEDGFGDAENWQAGAMMEYFSSLFVGGTNYFDGCSVWNTGSVWYLAEGATASGFETWVLVQNPGGDDVHVDFTLNTGEGAVKPPELQGVEIAAGTRRSFDLGAYVQTYDVSTKVSCSDGGVICERAMYWAPSPGASWTLGHDSIGYTP